MTFPDEETTMEASIRIWRWEDAPEEYRALSRHGGDEDWVALVPHHLAFEATNGMIAFLASGGPLGVSDISWHPLSDGAAVGIGAHA